MYSKEITYPQKVEAARRQLGTALHLWLEDLDHISVHTLASAGCEVSEGLVKAPSKAFLEINLDAHPDLNKKEIWSCRTKIYNATKHAKFQNGKQRDDEELLSLNIDAENEAIIFEGWFNLSQIIPFPIEAQLFIHWFLTKHINPEELDDISKQLFPSLGDKTPAQQKAMLHQQIKEFRRNIRLASDPETDPRPLILPAN